MLIWEQSGLEKVMDELEIMNSNPFYNELFYGKGKVEPKDIMEELLDIKPPRFRYVVKEYGKNAAIIEYLLHNPKDGKPWLGFLMVAKACQNQGLAKKLYTECENELRKMKHPVLRLGILTGNAPAFSFWSRMGFREIEIKENEGKKIHIFEKQF
ncbi:GNAT family N-acetyltransferase [Fictibacillus enclensis]|uniref:GNAT family N-acetyltransferase n=1 Tax=Fictibacillus enclensis TaxID=1017270 RepID=UPI0025A18B39|nr:GNAT family N-acetyltransferase [Fictibacillus enclensis]MDM5336998.1 GNAT family N-acetyltransferase [Fictibacillus enclensis]